MPSPESPSPEPPASESAAVCQRVSGMIRAAGVTLRAAGIDTPDHDAKLLLAEACGCELRDVDKAVLMGDRWADFVARRLGDDHGTSRETSRETSSDGGTSGDGVGADDMTSAGMIERRFLAMVERRAAREPLQYVVGHAPFRYLDLAVGPGVFIPRPETETVVQAGLDWLAAQGIRRPRVVDLCAGSGAIGLSVASELSESRVWAVELAERTYQWTLRNMRLVGRSDPTLADRYRLELGDAADPATFARLDGTIDIVITNPPYVPETAIPEQPEVRDHDPELALYGGSPDGLRIPERIILRSAALLRPGGALVMEHDVSQGAALTAYALDHGFIEAHTCNDWTGRPRYLFAMKP